MQCGIKKYDDLPARVGWIDVDYLRYQLYSIKKKESEIVSLLEKAREKK